MVVDTDRNAADGLTLIRLHDLVRTGRVVLERLARELEDYDPRVVHSHADLEASADRQRTVVKGVEDLLDIAELAHVLREPLLHRDDHSIDVALDSLIVAAAEWLRSGIADAGQLKLAARLLPAREGLTALADALASSDRPWMSEATVRDVLGAFRQFPASFVDRIGENADLDVDAPLDRLDVASVRRLMVGLRQAANDPDLDGGHP